VDKMSLCAVDIAEWVKLAESLGLTLQFMDGTDTSSIHRLASSLLKMQQSVHVQVGDSVLWSLNTHAVASSYYASL
jgi:hypothetical protein